MLCCHALFSFCLVILIVAVYFVGVVCVEGGGGGVTLVTVLKWRSRVLNIIVFDKKTTTS